MSTRSTIGGILASGSILAIAWAIGGNGLPVTQPAATGTTSGTASGSGAASGTTGSAPAATAAPSTGGSSGGSSSGSSSSKATDGTYTGQSVSTRFGDVQVQVTVSGGQITDVTALHLTDRESRSVSISNRAAPILRDEVLKAQSADVSMVSGATYTSEGYLTSLQSALDQAGL